MTEKQAVTRINHFKAAEGKAEELYQFLLSLTEYITNSEGCELYQVLRQSDNNNALVVIEKWQSTALHQQSILDYPKENMQAAMNLFAEPPSGNYYY